MRYQIKSSFQFTENVIRVRNSHLRNKILWRRSWFHEKFRCVEWILNSCQRNTSHRSASIEVEWTKRTRCLASKLSGSESFGFLLLGPLELTCLSDTCRYTERSYSSDRHRFIRHHQQNQKSLNASDNP